MTDHGASTKDSRVFGRSIGMLGEIRSSRSYRLSARSRAELDTTDLEIIEHLQDDGRIPFSVIARDLKVNEKVVSVKVEALRAASVLDITVVGDPAVLGYSRGALLGVTLPMNVLGEDVLDRVGELPHVPYAALTTGRYQLIVEVFFNDGPELAGVCQQIAKLTSPDAHAEILPYVQVDYQQSNWRQTFRKASAEQTSPIVANPVSIGRVDREIIRQLSSDGRKSFRTIGADLDISEGQVRQRYKRLFGQGAMRVQAIVHPATLGYNAVAWVGVRVQGATGEVLDRLVSIEGVTYAVTCFGRFDVLLEIVATDEASLLRIVEMELQRAPNVFETETFLLLGLYYKRIDPNG